MFFPDITNLLTVAPFAVSGRLFPPASDVRLHRVRPSVRQTARGAVPRPARTQSRRHAGRRRLPSAAPAERLVHPAPRADAARGGALRRAVVAPAARAGADRARLRPRLRPFHDAAEPAVQLDPDRARRRRDGRPRRGRHARHPDQRQLHPQHHQRLLCRRRARRDRRSAALLRDPAPVEHAAPGVRLPAAQVQDRRHRGQGGPRRHRLARHRPAAAEERRRRSRLQGARRRRHGPHAGPRQRRRRVRAVAAHPRLHRGDRARLQPLRPARQHVQGAHQDPRQGRGEEVLRPGRGGVQEHPRTRRGGQRAPGPAGRVRPRRRLVRAARRAAPGRGAGARRRRRRAPRLPALDSSATCTATACPDTGR